MRRSHALCSSSSFLRYAVRSISSSASSSERRTVAVQHVEFEKPNFETSVFLHFIGSRFETRHFQAMGQLNSSTCTAPPHVRRRRRTAAAAAGREAARDSLPIAAAAAPGDAAAAAAPRGGGPRLLDGTVHALTRRPRRRVGLSLPGVRLCYMDRTSRRQLNRVLTSK